MEQLLKSLAKIKVWYNMYQAWNRSVDVQIYLLRCAQGKEPLPDEEKCRELALDLGVPDKYRKRKRD